MHKPPLKPKKCQKNAKKCQKRPKMQKPKKWTTKNWPLLIPNSHPNPENAQKSTVHCKKKDGLSENPPKKHKNALFSLGSQRNNFNFTYSESVRRDDFGKVGHLYGPFFLSWVPFRHHVFSNFHGRTEGSVRLLWIYAFLRVSSTKECLDEPGTGYTNIRCYSPGNLILA